MITKFFLIFNKKTTENVRKIKKITMKRYVYSKDIQKVKKYILRIWVKYDIINTIGEIDDIFFKIGISRSPLPLGSGQVRSKVLVKIVLHVKKNRGTICM